MMCRILAFDASVSHAKLLAEIGVKPDWTDEMGMPAIHIAGWEGQAEALRWLLEYRPDLRLKNKYGGDLMGTILHGLENCPSANTRNHIECVRLVLGAGSPLHRQDIKFCGVPAVQAFLEEWAEKHPECLID